MDFHNVQEVVSYLESLVDIHQPPESIQSLVNNDAMYQVPQFDLQFDIQVNSQFSPHMLPHENANFQMQTTISQQILDQLPKLPQLSPQQQIQDISQQQIIAQTPQFLQQMPHQQNHQILQLLQQFPSIQQAPQIVISTPPTFPLHFTPPTQMQISPNASPQLSPLPSPPLSPLQVCPTMQFQQPQLLDPASFLTLPKFEVPSPSSPSPHTTNINKNIQTNNKRNKSTPSRTYLSSRHAATPYDDDEKPRRVDYTKVFQTEFQALLNENKKAKRDWKIFRRSMARNCTHKWCILVKREFCVTYSAKFSELLKDARFEGLGTRSGCGCRRSAEEEFKSGKKR